MSNGDAVELFAGPGGWSEGAALLGMRSADGLEIDETACATARAAGHRRRKVDVTKVDPREYAGVSGVIASPVCTGFSTAGKGLGRLDRPAILEAVKWIERGGPPDKIIEMYSGRFQDKYSRLALEPLRWIDALYPEWAAWEQVPAVLPLWEACAAVLRHDGYSVWTGNMKAERYGVPQTRTRAVLIASRVREVGEPRATHSTYHVRDPQRLDDGVAPWVSMAQALGWAGDDLVGFPRRADTPSNGAGDDVIELNGTEYRARDLAPATRPAQSMTGKVRSVQRWTHFEPTLPVIDSPAPTVMYGHDSARARFVLRAGTGDHAAARPLDAPAATVLFGARLNSVQWMEAPATTVQGDPRIADRDGHDRQFAPDAMRITPQEAAVLQSFRADYPWQGTPTKQFQQIGNAVPPLLAAHILAEATGVPLG